MFELYNISDFDISYNTQPSQCHTIDIRIGHIRDQLRIPPSTSGLADNDWFIVKCGEDSTYRNILLDLEFAIKELFINEIYKTILGYAPDTLIAYDAQKQCLYRVSRKIIDAQPWMNNSSIPNIHKYSSPIDNYNIEPCGTLVDQQGNKNHIFGLATIAVLSFLLGDGDVHSRQYLLQHQPEIKIWKVDNQCALMARYPINIETLVNLPHYKSSGYLQRFNMAEDIPKSIISSSAFQREKIIAVEKILLNAETFELLLEKYCNPENYNLSIFEGSFTAEEIKSIPETLLVIRDKFRQGLMRLLSPALQEFVNRANEQETVQRSQPSRLRT